MPSPTTVPGAQPCALAFTLAAAGLLDGRRATTHWQWAGELARRYPDIDVDPGVLFVDEGPVLTSAGVASGLDLCLHLIRQHAGPDLAGRTARRVVIPAWRDGGQAQYIEHAGPADANHPLQPTIAWMDENAVSALDLQAIANHASVSVRTLNPNSVSISAPPRWDCSPRCDSTVHDGCWNPPR